MSPKTLIAHNPGINWCWFAHIDLHDNVAYVTNEYRLHYRYDAYDIMSLPSTHTYQIVEYPSVAFTERMAIGIRIDNDFYRFQHQMRRWDVGRVTYVTDPLQINKGCSLNTTYTRIIEWMMEDLLPDFGLWAPDHVLENGILKITGNLDAGV